MAVDVSTAIVTISVPSLMCSSGVPLSQPLGSFQALTAMVNLPRRKESSPRVGSSTSGQCSLIQAALTGEQTGAPGLLASSSSTMWS